jgi:hypothetical protein
MTVTYLGPLARWLTHVLRIDHGRTTGVNQPNAFRDPRRARADGSLPVADPEARTSRETIMDHRALCEVGAALMRREAAPLRELLGYDPGGLKEDAALIAEVLARAVPEGPERGAVRTIAHQYFSGPLGALAAEDVAVTARRDADPGGGIATLLFGNGLHALLGHRLAHAALDDGLTASALALKGRFLRAFGADIWPQARIGRRVWIDHGLGLVIGQTAVIEEDVSLWHGVTLGTDLVDRGDAPIPACAAAASSAPTPS